MAELTGSEILAKCLKAEGVDLVDTAHQLPRSTEIGGTVSFLLAPTNSCSTPATQVFLKRVMEV